MTNNCPYKGCYYNENGFCNCKNSDFIEKLQEACDGCKTNEEILKNITDVEFNCHKVRIDDNCCIYCGNQLKWHDEYEIIDGITYKIGTYGECPNGCV